MGTPLNRRTPMFESRPQSGATPLEAASSVSDDTLVRWLRCGNDGAANRLYSRYVDRLRALARAKLSTDLSRRVDAEDIVQSVFRRFFQAARRGNYDAPAG